MQPKPKFLAVLILFAPMAVVTSAADERPGSLDFSFVPGTNFGSVSALALQPDGRLIGGGGDPYQFHVVARLHEDGSLDASFKAGLRLDTFVNVPTITALAVQNDGKIVVGGDDVRPWGYGSSFLRRLNPDGSLDVSFLPQAGGRVVALQNDGKILVAGGAYGARGFSTNWLTRLNPDGASDTDFITPKVNSVYAMALASDGKILIGGYFTRVNDVPRSGLARLNANGTLDTTFAPVLSPIESSVITLALVPDGRLLIAGSFTSVNGASRTKLARLRPDGSLDASFSVDGITNSLVSYSVNSLEVQSDGRALIGGHFTQVGGRPRNGIARLNADGSLDTNFDPGSGVQSTNGNYFSVNTIVVQPDGQIVIGGQFDSINRVPRPGVARLNGDGKHIRLSPPALASEGKLRVVVNSLPGRAYTLQASTNLIDWVPVGTKIATGATVEFDDTASLSQQRLYRARLEP